MLKLKNLFRNMEFVKPHRIRFFFSISAFTCFKQTEEKRTKKTKSLQLIKRTRKYHPIRTSDK